MRLLLWVAVAALTASPATAAPKGDGFILDTVENIFIDLAESYSPMAVKLLGLWVFWRAISTLIRWFRASAAEGAKLAKNSRNTRGGR